MQKKKPKETFTLCIKRNGSFCSCPLAISKTLHYAGQEQRAVFMWMLLTSLYNWCLISPDGGALTKSLPLDCAFAFDLWEIVLSVQKKKKSCLPVRQYATDEELSSKGTHQRSKERWFRTLIIQWIRLWLISFKSAKTPQKSTVAVTKTVSYLQTFQGYLQSRKHIGFLKTADYTGEKIILKSL